MNIKADEVDVTTGNTSGGYVYSGGLLNCGSAQDVFLAFSECKASCFLSILKHELHADNTCKLRTYHIQNTVSPLQTAAG
jgi:hypothetical protein